ncbi:hypothetical protein [Methylomonas albis]|uniref:hypothetical protein n=1 Tax=Methylomonas albis TaxID=1854563 RepID=UPI0019E92255|nr:hypothetical protein [Methylomonas albis]CAD6877434.1 hypothetical protein [Methylomonas albis]
MISEEQTLEDFDNFLMVMDDQLEALHDEATKRGLTLDLSLDDLERLEKLFDLMSDGVDNDTRSSLIVSFGRHLGEVVRENYGGRWSVPLDDEKNINFNKPVIIGHTKIEGLEFAPLTVMRAYSLRKKSGTLRRAVEADVNPQVLDLSEFIEN